MTFDRSTRSSLRQMDLLELMSCAEAFPAKTSALPINTQKGLAATDPASGSRCSASSAKRGLAGSLPKMSQPFALADWKSFSGASLRSGMMRSGTAYPLPPLAPLTDETAPGLWPTMTVRDRESPAKLKRGANASPGGTPLVWAIIQDCYKNTTLPAVLGRLNPAWVDWLMGYPVGWTTVEG